MFGGSAQERRRALSSLSCERLTCRWACQIGGRRDADGRARKAVRPRWQSVFLTRPGPRWSRMIVAGPSVGVIPQTIADDLDARISGMSWVTSLRLAPVARPAPTTLRDHPRLHDRRSSQAKITNVLGALTVLVGLDSTGQIPAVCWTGVDDGRWN